MAGIGSELNNVLEQVKNGGKIAYPNGVEPLPKGRDGVKLIAFDGRPSQEIFDHLNELIETGNFKVEINRMYAMEGMGPGDEGCSEASHWKAGTRGRLRPEGK